MTKQSKIQEMDHEWHAALTPEQYRVLREKGTGAPGSGEYYDSAMSLMTALNPRASVIVLI